MSTFRLSLVFIGLALLLVLSGLLLPAFFVRLDLTADQRYTLSPAVRHLLGQLPDQVRVVVYLDGELPAGFRRLRNTLEEKLREFESDSKGKLSFQFIDPAAIGDEKARNRFYTQLARKGIQPTNLFAREGEKKTERLIFPGALVSYQDKETSLMLLNGTKSAPPEEILNQSAENVEFELANAIRRLTLLHKKKVGILSGHGEPDDLHLAGLIEGLQQYYDVFRVPLSQVTDTALRTLDGLIVVKPDTVYGDANLYKLDQYIVKGGRVLFFLDALRTDEVQANGSLAAPVSQDISGLLFRYGVRLNNDLLKDLTSARIPMVTGKMGTGAQTQLMPYRYFPLLNTFAPHPITRNSDVLYLRFSGTLDTVKADGIRKTPLLFSSPYSKVLSAPVMISYDDARRDPDPASYNQGKRMVACLLEGRFHSYFANQPAASQMGFVAYGQAAQLLVCADGDLAESRLNAQGQPLPLGFDPISRQRFGNEAFVMRAVDYLVSRDGLLAARSRQLVLRPLDKKKVRDERLYWQVLNLLGPLTVLGLAGLTVYYLRRRNYAR